MAFITFLLIFVLFLSGLMLIGLVLIQKTKGEGLGMSFGQGMGESIFGSRAGNVLTKATVVLAVIFLSSTLVLAVLYAGNGGDASVMSDYADPTAATETPELPAAAPEGAVAVDTSNIDLSVVPGAVVEAAEEAVVEAEEVAQAVADEAADVVAPASAEEVVVPPAE